MNRFEKFLGKLGRPFTKSKAKRLSKDSHGRTIANRQGVDTVPNEPFDCLAPPIRYESKEQVDRVKQALEEKGSK
jgi:hypothetical protein